MFTHKKIPFLIFNKYLYLFHSSGRTFLDILLTNTSYFVYDYNFKIIPMMMTSKSFVFYLCAILYFLHFSIGAPMNSLPPAWNDNPYV